MSRGEDTQPNNTEAFPPSELPVSHPDHQFFPDSMTTAAILNLPPGDQPGWAGLQPLNGYVWWVE